MRLGALLMVLVLVAVGGFALLNWSVLSTPTAISLGLAEIQAPLGLIMLGMMVALLTLLLAYVLYLQTTVLLENRARTKELQANRKLADQAEASRFTELRNFLEAELKGQAAAHQDAQRALLARIDALERELRLSVEQSGNSLAASLAEVDDRMCRQLPAPLIDSAP